MADITPSNASQNGVALSPTAASAGGDTCLQTKRIILLVANAGENPCNVTVHCQRACCGLPEDHDKVTTVPAGYSRYIGPFNKAMYNDTAGKLEIKYNQVTSVTVAALEVADL